MDLTTKAKIQVVKHYINALPKSLPVSNPSSSLNQLLYFSLDQEWVLEIGEEHAVNRSLEIAMQDFSEWHG